MSNENNVVALSVAGTGFEYWEKVCLALMLDEKRLGEVLADPKLLSTDELGVLKKRREVIFARRNAIVQGGALDRDEKAFMEDQLKKWPHMDMAAQKKADAEVRKYVPPARLHEDCAKWLRACAIAVYAPSVQPPAKFPVSAAEKQLSEKAAKGLLCPNASCRSPRSTVIQTRKDRDGVKRERECASCRRRWWTREK